jgi:hypothetical protein
MFIIKNQIRTLIEQSLLLASPTWVAASNKRFLLGDGAQSDWLLINKELGGRSNFICPIQKCSLSKIKRELVMCPSKRDGIQSLAPNAAHSLCPNSLIPEPGLF